MPACFVALIPPYEAVRERCVFVCPRVRVANPSERQVQRNMLHSEKVIYGVFFRLRFDVKTP